MKAIPLALGRALLSPSRDWDRVDGNGWVNEERRYVNDFTAVEVHDGLHGTIRPGPTLLIVKIDSNLHHLLSTRVLGRTLKIRPLDDVDIDPSDRHEIRITSPRIERISLSGGAGFFADVTPTETLPLSVSDESHLQVRSIESTHVSITASGDSSILADGIAQTLSIEASGDSVVESTLAAETVEVDIRGDSKVEIRASHAVRGRASGDSRLVVHGQPHERNVQTSGDATVIYVE